MSCVELGELRSSRFSAQLKALRMLASVSPRIGSSPPTASVKRLMRRSRTSRIRDFNRVDDVEIEDDDRVLLADPVDAADSLLDLHRVPGQVVVDHEVAELKVTALAPRLSADQIWGPEARETLDGIVLLQRRELAVELMDTPARLTEISKSMS